jgi:metallo-beta-lactamase family protein
MVVFDLEENGRRCRFAFSGDIGRGRNDILRDPSLPEDVDYLMMETTYGNRDHENRDDVNARICEIINRTIERRGKIVIPAFAVGRTQQLLYTLYQLKQDGCIPELPIYVDSPLASKATETFNHHLECFNKGFSELMRRRDTPFNTGNVTYTGSVEESMRLNDLPGPCIILSASGMAEAGRIRHHIKNTVEDDRNTILIVGWCAPHTLGSHLASGHKEVNIFGEPHRVRADIRTIDAFSGHADRRELEEWAANLTGPLKGIYLIHGEELPARALGVALQKIHPAADIRVPDYLDSVQW